MVKRKIVMRVCSLALCVVFTGLLFGAPKAHAVVTETAIGTAAVASYFQATGLTMAASAGSTGALVTAGVADIAGSYAVATGAASSGSAFLSSLAAGVSISPAGALVLTAAAVVAIGALVAWYIAENGLEEEGSTAVAVPGVSDKFSYGGALLPPLPTWDTSVYRYACIRRDGSPSAGTGVYDLFIGSSPFVAGSGDISGVINGGDFLRYGIPFSAVSSASSWTYVGTGDGDIGFNRDVYPIIWTDFDILYSSGSVFLLSSVPEPVGDVQSRLEVIRAPEFVQPDVDFTPESQKQMVIDLGFGTGTTLETVAEEVPNLIVAGELAPTYEIQSTAPDADDDLPYIPILSEILQGVQSIARTVVDGILNGLEGLFVPSETYLEALPAQITETFENRTGFLTYPFSLLPDFVDRLSAPSDDWILKWPQIAEPFTGTILFQQGSWNVTAFVQANVQFKRLYDLWRLIAKALMSFGFIGLCYNKYRSVVGDHYGEG